MFNRFEPVTVSVADLADANGLPRNSKLMGMTVSPDEKLIVFRFELPAIKGRPVEVIFRRRAA